MKNSIALLVVVLLLCPLWTKAQEQELFANSFTESTSIQEKFSIYLDSIDKYLYRDVEISEKALAVCDEILKSGVHIHDTLQFSLVLSRIYAKYSKADPLGAYQIILDYEKLIDEESLSDGHIENFNYLRSFTYMSVGDLEEAQKAYYKGIEHGVASKDTGIVIRYYLSMAQLLNDERDLEGALSYLHKIIELHKVYDCRPSTIAIAYIDLMEAYINSEEYGKALEAFEQGTIITKASDLNLLYSDLLLLKGSVHINHGQIDSAFQTYKVLESSRQSMKDLNNLQNSKYFLSEIYSAKRMYPEALKIYKEIILASDTSNINNLLEVYKDAQFASKEMGYYKSALEYLEGYTDLKKKNDEDLRKQKTAYLEIKFDSEQKNKENLLLAAEVSQNQAAKKWLYRLMALSSLFLLLLFGAFYQRFRYSKQLESEVLRRTEKLKFINQKLNNSMLENDEFNRILSHDLTEPLRNIVGFSQLAKRDILDIEKTNKNLDFVISSGYQLENLIKDVGRYREINQNDTQRRDEINLSKLLDDVRQKVQLGSQGKIITVHCEVNEIVIGPLEILKSVFEILIENALKFNVNKEVVINVKCSTNGGQYNILVKDNGIGIDSEHHSKVFEMFKRLNQRADYPGSGLGLSIGKRMLEIIDGNISIQGSKQNEGTTFLLRFPALGK